MRRVDGGGESGGEGHLDLEIAEAVLEMHEASGGLDLAALRARFPGRERAIEACVAGLALYDTELSVQRAGALGLRAPLAAGTRVGRYHIAGLLGSGAMGVVYRARDGEHEVALKVLRAELVTHDPRFLERFRREAELAMRVAAPGVARVLDFGEADGHVFLAMELVEGLSLADVLRDLDEARRAGSERHESLAFVREAARLVLRVARGLERLHAEQLVHRDVKPSNILLRDARDAVTALECEPVLIDFGLLRSVAPSELTGSRTLLGTPAFASPEARLGRDVDERTDVFSLGAVLHDLLSLELAGRRNPATAGLSDVRSHNTHVDARLAAIVRMALEERPELRYASSRAFGDDLERFLAGRNVRALPSAPFARLSLWFRRDPSNGVRVLAWVAAAFVVLLAALAGGTNVVRTQRALADARALVAEGELPAAIEAWRHAQASPRTFAWLAHDDEARAAADFERRLAEARMAELQGRALAAGTMDLGQVLLDLAAGDQEGFERAHDRALMLLCTPGHDELRPTLLAFLGRELAPDRPTWRRALSARSAAELAMGAPTLMTGGAPLPPAAARLRDQLFESIEGEPELEIARLALSALTGLLDEDSVRQLLALNARDDLELRRIQLYALLRYLRKLDSTAELPPPELFGASLQLAFEAIAHDALHAGFVPWTETEEDTWPYITLWAPHARLADAAVKHFVHAVIVHFHVERALRLGLDPYGGPVDAAFLARAEELRDQRRSGLFAPTLVEFLEVPLERHLAYAEGGLLPVGNRMLDLYEALPGASPLRAFLATQEAATTTFFHLGDAGRMTPGATEVTFSNVWDQSTSPSGAARAAAPEGDALHARFRFQARKPLFEGGALAVRWERAVVIPETEQRLDGGHSYLELRGPRSAWFELDVQVPEGAQHAKVRVHHVMAARELMPFTGSSDARIRFNGRTEYTLPVDQRSALQTTSRELGRLAESDFLVNAADLADREVLTIRYEHASGPNLIWLHSIYVNFDDEPFSLDDR